MNYQLALHLGQERLESLRHEASLMRQIKALLAPRPMKRNQSLQQFEQRRVST